jgi:hypothetical protein
MVERKGLKAKTRGNSIKNRNRKPYRTPQLIEYGTLEIITQGTGSKGKEAVGFTMN